MLSRMQYWICAMLADLPFWHQLWNKGVDIAAGILTTTITAAIIALIATLMWRWNKAARSQARREQTAAAA